jgi:hypothetical protein
VAEPKLSINKNYEELNSLPERLFSSFSAKQTVYNRFRAL